MFLSTLGRKTDGIVTELRKRRNSSFSNFVSPINDNRGRQPCLKTADKDDIIQHINSYHPCVTHYMQKNAPNRRYINPDLTVSDMYKDYNEKATIQVCYNTYRTVFNQQNIGFSQPSVDECPICLSNKDHMREILMDELHDSQICESCQLYDAHKKKYVESREEYQREIPPEVVSFTGDMQKVLIIPKLTTKEHLFVSRLVVFNETFACRSGGHPDFCILWHEAISGRKATDVASSYFKLLSEAGVPENVEIWTDNCSGQNKNWYLLTTLVQCVNTWGPNIITMKYLEKGHTFMAADTVHGAIGKKWKKKTKVADFADFVEICEKATKDTKAVIIDIPYFFKGQQRKIIKKG